MTGPEPIDSRSTEGQVLHKMDVIEIHLSDAMARLDELQQLVRTRELALTTTQIETGQMWLAKARSLLKE